MGIPPEQLSRIFDLYYTTKETGQRHRPVARLSGGAAAGRGHRSAVVAGPRDDVPGACCQRRNLPRRSRRWLRHNQACDTPAVPCAAWIVRSPGWWMRDHARPGGSAAGDARHAGAAAAGRGPAAAGSRGTAGACRSASGATGDPAARLASPASRTRSRPRNPSRRRRRRRHPNRPRLCRSRRRAPISWSSDAQTPDDAEQRSGCARIRRSSATDARAHYQRAQSFMTQAFTALRNKNYPFAEQLAKNAATLAKELRKAARRSARPLLLEFRPLLGDLLERELLIAGRRELTRAARQHDAAHEQIEIGAQPAPRCAE